MDTCLPHRYDDMHDCKPVKQTETYEKIKKSNFGFNWGGSRKSIKKEESKKSSDQELSFGDKVLRFFICCGGNPKDKNDKAK